MRYKAYYKIDGVDIDTPILFTASNLVDAQKFIQKCLEDLQKEGHMNWKFTHWEIVTVVEA